MKVEIGNDASLLEDNDTNTVSALGGRMSQSGKEQIESAHKIIIVEANAYLIDAGIYQKKYEGVFVALAVDKKGIRLAVQSRNSNWYFDEPNKAIRSIRRLNKAAEIIIMEVKEYRQLVEQENMEKQSLVELIITANKELGKPKTMLKPNLLMHHVVYNKNVFEVGFYSKKQINKQKNELLALKDQPEPIYTYVFHPVISFKTLEDAETYAMNTNVLSALRGNTDETLQAFLNEQNEIQDKEFLKHAEDFEKDQLQQN
jgi:hypothetical protein